MSYQRRYNVNMGGGNNPFSSITGIIMAVLFFLVLFYLTRIVFKILWFAAPFLFIASLIIDHTVFLGYAKWIGGMLKRNPLVGIGAIVLSVLLFPLTASFLFGKALFRKKVKEAQKEYENQVHGELIDFEEVVEDREEMNDDALRLPPMEKEPRPRRSSSSRKDNEYDDLFE